MIFDNIAPNITRRRLLIEGYYEIDMNKKTIETFFKEIITVLKLRSYGDPLIFSPGGEGKEENQGYDAFLPLIDSEISLYEWEQAKFFSIIIFSCKHFEDQKTVQTIKGFLNSNKLEFLSF